MRISPKIVELIRPIQKMHDAGTLYLCCATIHEKLNSVYEAGVIRGQETRYFRYFVRLPQATKRNLFEDLSSERTTVAIVLEQIGGYCEPRPNVNRPTPRSRYDVGHAVFVPADTPIWGYSDNIRMTRDLRLHFDVGALPKVLGDDLNYARTAPPLLMLYDERVTRCAELLADECDNSLPENRMYGESLTMALMAALFVTRTQSNRANDSGLARWQLRRVLEFLESHLGNDIGLDELARLVGLSQSQFARAFKASTGLPPYKWWLGNRIKRAQEMLLNSSDSLSEIAMRNGFADQSHFTKTFRRLTGTTPANWKRARRN